MRTTRRKDLEAPGESERMRLEAQAAREPFTQEQVLAICTAYE